MSLSPFIPLKLLTHKQRVDDARQFGMAIAPISVEFDLSNTCPHDCPFCSFGTSKSGGYRQQNWVQFPFERAMTLLEELKAAGVKSVTFTGGGEPLVHKHAADILAQAQRLGLEFGVVTNGFNLRGAVRIVIAEYAKFVRVSLDAGSATTHHFTHGLPEGQFQFDQILANIAATRALAADRKDPLTIGASFCVMDQNWKEIELAANAVKHRGANYLEVRPTFPTEWRGDGWGNALSEANIEAARSVIDLARSRHNSDDFQVIGMIERFDSLAKPEKRYRKCRSGLLTSVIGAEGSLWWCCIQRGQPFFALGNVIDKPFREVWAGALARMMPDNIDVTQCPRCRYDGYNELLDDTADKLHANFI